jgi:hypothetical protein
MSAALAFLECSIGVSVQNAKTCRRSLLRAFPARSEGVICVKTADAR